MTDLSNGVAYIFQVRAVNRAGDGHPFTPAAATPSTVPPAPTDVTATRGNGEVSLTWNAGTPGDAGDDDWASATTGWQVKTDDGAWTDIADSGANTASHTVGELTNGTEYTFAVRAVNDQGSGEAGTSNAVTPATTPSATTLTVTRGDGMATLAWTAVDDGGDAVTAWHLQTDGGDWAPIADSGADTASHTVDSLVNGTEYTYAVRAANTVGDGAASNSVSVTPGTTPSAPTVTATAGDGMVTLMWTAGDDGGYAVTAWHLQVSGGDWVDLSTYGLGADTSSLTVPNLTNGTAYTFGVRAANGVGDGAAGTAEATPATTPSAPTVTATGSDGEITVSWTSGGDGGSTITGWQYRMSISISDYGAWMDTDATSITLSDLDSGTGVLSYTFQVRGVNAIGAGAEGTSDSVTPVEDPAVNGMYYSGVVTGPNFCAELSLGGARLFAFDSDGDGVADVCALPFTKREAIARQNAVATLASQHADDYAALVNAACDTVEGDDACGGDTLSSPGVAPINDGGPFYSGIITGPSFCANRSLGGPVTYPFDSDGDGVADTCAYPYTRREAVARQLAGDILAALNPAAFQAAVKDECRRLSGANYGDDPAHLAEDICA